VTQVDLVPASAKLSFSDRLDQEREAIWILDDWVVATSHTQLHVLKHSSKGLTQIGYYKWKVIAWTSDQNSLSVVLSNLTMLRLGMSRAPNVK
jgi:hypothetical protein